jgi:hypothetical protein
MFHAKINTLKMFEEILKCTCDEIEQDRLNALIVEDSLVDIL